MNFRKEDKNKHMAEKRTRRDTKVESEGAEFLVLGRLLLGYVFIN